MPNKIPVKANRCSPSNMRRGKHNFKCDSMYIHIVIMANVYYGCKILHMHTYAQG